MKFTEAKRIVREFEGGPPLEFLLAMSGQPEPLDPFLEAAAAERGFKARVRSLPFNTLGQMIRAEPTEGEQEVFLLFPWDLLPELEWRSGFTASAGSLASLVTAARETLSLIQARGRPPILYVDADAPAALLNSRESAALRHHLLGEAIAVGARVLPGDVVSLESLFRSGFPLGSHALGDVARHVVAAAIDPSPSRGKVLVTDFDNTLWAGIVGEDGVDGLEYSPQGVGFPHFVFQTFLKRLKGAGILIAGVTKNDEDLARAPLELSDSVLSPDDFVSILASYHPKSTQIKQLADQLNLGLDAFAFVDDNQVELEEVGRALPEVRTIRFPREPGGLPRLFEELGRFFHTEAQTEEDAERTEMYRRRLAGLVPSDAQGSDLTDFLAGLEMRLEIRDRSSGDRERAVQLINKTNQFNLNGIRRSDEEIEGILGEGGRLFTAALADRHGSHGEILSCLIDSSNRIRSLVLSCRVFQRRVEHGFLAWLADRVTEPVELEFQETERNEPIRQFLRDAAVSNSSDAWRLNLPEFARAHAGDLELFDLSVS